MGAGEQETLLSKAWKLLSGRTDTGNSICWAEQTSQLTEVTTRVTTFVLDPGTGDSDIILAFSTMIMTCVLKAVNRSRVLGSCIHLTFTRQVFVSLSLLGMGCLEINKKQPSIWESREGPQTPVTDAGSGK
jgi:hypothetical protein